MESGRNLRQPCTVLIVDDDPDAREVLRLLLCSNGYSVATARDGRAALTSLRSRTDICVVLLDLNLPGMNGRQFRAAQRRDRSLAWIPVVVISGEPDGRDLARKLGAAAFIAKPVDLDQIECLLSRIGCGKRSSV